MSPKRRASLQVEAAERLVALGAGPGVPHGKADGEHRRRASVHYEVIDKEAGEVKPTSSVTPISASWETDALIRLMIMCGMFTGVLAYIYDWMMDTGLKVVWEYIPEKITELVGDDPEGMALLDKWGFLYIVVVTITLGTCAGLMIKLLGYPGDLPEIVWCVHNQGWVPMSQTPSMVMCSLFSIVAGGSLGPEAPLVAISASCCGWLSYNYFDHDPTMTRKFTLMGMCAGLSAFFGVLLGGALFALEVCHTMGLQFFETSVYCVGAGAINLVIFRFLQGQEVGWIWDFPDAPNSTAFEVMEGCLLGVVASAVALLFHKLHKGIGKLEHGYGKFEDSEHPVMLAMMGAICVAIIGIFLPPTMFWGEFELKSVAVPSKELEHIWPKGGFWGLEPFEWDNGVMCLVVGLFKLVAISCTVHGGFRGGFIFPLMFSGSCLGKAIIAIPGMDQYLTPAVACMCMASALCTAVTRTPFACALITVELCGQPAAAGPVTAATMVALFMTHKYPFIGAQQDRTDLLWVQDLVDRRTMETPSKDAANDVPVAATVTEGEPLVGSAASKVNGSYAATDVERVAF